MRTVPSLLRAGLPLALAVALPAAAAGAPAAAEKKPFTIADLYRVGAVAEPVLSPDGKTVVYTLGTTDLPAVKRQVNLWRASTSGSGPGPRALTVADKRDTSPRFSPDGRTVLFVSSRSGDSQLWTMPVDGGEPEKRSDVPGGVSDPLFTPDGRSVVFGAEVYPECGADAACNRKLDDAREKGKLKAHVADALFFRHWDSWRDGKRSHVLVLDLSDPKARPRDLTPGDFDSPALAGGGRGFDLSPDGKTLVFTSNREKEPASSTNSDLFAVRLDATDEELKSPRNLTAKNPAHDGSPRFSPDGRSVAYRRQATPGYESDRLRLALLELSTGTTRDVAEGLDAWVEDFAFSRDGKSLYFTAQVKGRLPLHALDLASGTVRELTRDGVVDSFALSPDGSFAVLARRRMDRPAELTRLALAGAGAGQETPLTAHNAPLLAEVDFRPAEEIFVDGADGKKVQVWLLKPHGFDPGKRYPLVVNVHGGPQMQWADAFRGDAQVYPGAGYVVAFPNPHGSTGWGQAYTAAISKDWDGKVMEDVAKVTDHLAKLPYVDPERIGAMGWSWGGYAMMWLAGHTTRYKALAAMMGVYDLRTMASTTEELWFPDWDLGGTPWTNPEGYRRQSPSSYVTAFRTPTLVVTGQRDYRVPYSQSVAFFTDLQRMKVPSRLVVFEEAGHWPGWYEMVLYYAAHLDWFHRWLGGAPSPWDPKELARNTVFGKDEKK